MMKLPTIERTRGSMASMLHAIRGQRRSVAARIQALRHAGEQGQALVEMAVVAPCLLLITFGMCIFGIGLNEQLVLTNAVEQGAQALAVSRGVSDPCATVVSAVEGAAPNLSPSSMSFTIIISGSSTSATSCTSLASSMTSGASGSVEVSYPFTANFILFGSHSYTLDAKTAEIIE
jgi:TadE-like protein